MVEKMTQEGLFRLQKSLVRRKEDLDCACPKEIEFLVRLPLRGITSVYPEPQQNEQATYTNSVIR